MNTLWVEEWKGNPSGADEWRRGPSWGRAVGHPRVEGWRVDSTNHFRHLKQSFEIAKRDRPPLILPPWGRPHLHPEWSTPLLYTHSLLLEEGGPHFHPRSVLPFPSLYLEVAHSFTPGWTTHHP